MTKQKTSFSTIKKLLKKNQYDGNNKLITQWLSNKNEEEKMNLSLLKQGILPFVTTIQRIGIIKLWLSKNKDQIDTKELMSLFPEDIDDYDKAKLIKAWLLNHDNKANNLIKILKSNNSLRYKSDIIIDSIIDGLEISDNNIKYVLNQLYKDSKKIQSEFIKQCITSNIFKHNTLKNIIEDEKDDDIALDLLSCAIEYSSDSLTKNEILNLTKGRSSSQYKSIELILTQNTNLKSLLTKQGMEECKELIDKNNKLSLKDIFYYHFVHDDIITFRELLKPDVQEQIKSRFEISSNQPYVSLKEYNQISDLIDEEKKLQDVGGLCDVFKEKIKIPKINLDNYKISFSKNSSIAPLEQEKLNVYFRKLLNSDDVQEKEVIYLFENVLELYDFDKFVNNSNKQDLTSFFNINKKKIAALFGEKNGVEKFINAYYAISDGCTANVNTQFRIALNNAILGKGDIKTRILYNLLQNSIILSIINTTDDIIGDYDNPLDNSTIRKYMISPKGLFLNLMDNIKPLEVNDILSQEIKKILENDNFEEEYKNQKIIACCLILEDLMPKILKDDSLKDYTNYFKEIKNKALKKEARIQNDDKKEEKESNEKMKNIDKQPNNPNPNKDVDESKTPEIKKLAKSNIAINKGGYFDSDDESEDSEIDNLLGVNAFKNLKDQNSKNAIVENEDLFLNNLMEEIQRDEYSKGVISKLQNSPRSSISSNKEIMPLKDNNKDNSKGSSP